MWGNVLGGSRGGNEDGYDHISLSTSMKLPDNEYLGKQGKINKYMANLAKKLSRIIAKGNMVDTKGKEG